MKPLLPKMYGRIVAIFTFLAGLSALPDRAVAFPENSYNVFTLHARVIHNEKICSSKKKDSHIWLSFEGQFTSVNDQQLGCFFSDCCYGNILGHDSASTEIPLHFCIDYYPEFQFNPDDYFLRLGLYASKTSFPPTGGFESGLGGGSGNIPTVEIIDNEQYQPFDPAFPVVRIPLRKMLKYGYRTQYECETIELTLRPKCNLFIQETQTEYIGYPYRYSLRASAECPANSDYVVTKSLYLWDYAHENTDGFQPLSQTGDKLTLRLEDFPDLPVGKNILIKLADGATSNSRNTKTICFYPDIPQPTRTMVQLIPRGEEYLKNITLSFNRLPRKELNEKLRTLTLYDRVAVRPDGSINGNESRIIFQQSIDMAKLKANRTYTFSIPDRTVSEGTYYVTVEGTVNGNSNNPTLPENKNLPDHVKTAMFRCFPITVRKNEVSIERIDFTPPVCHGGKGSLQVTLNESFYLATSPLPEFYYQKKDGSSVRIPFDCLSIGSMSDKRSVFRCREIEPSMTDFEIIIKSTSFSSGSLGSGQSGGNASSEEPKKAYFSIDFTQPEKLYVPIEKKDNSGYYYEDDRSYAAQDGKITVRRDAARNGKPPYDFSYVQENISLANRFYLYQDIIPAPNGGTFRVFMEDNAGCSFDTLLFVGNLNNYLKVDLEIEQPISCYNAQDGILKAKMIYQSSDRLTYAWYKDGKLLAGRTGLGLDCLGPGVYKVVVTDLETGMSASRQITLSQPPELSLTEYLVSDISCYGKNTGYIGVKGNGGTPPYLYAWGDGSSEAIRSGLPAGKHSLKLIDQNGCYLTRDFFLNQPEQPFEIVIDTIIHAHYDHNDRYIPGRIVISGKGGTPPYGWLHFQGEHDPDRLDSGWYEIFQWDALHCQDAERFRIELYNKMKAEIIVERENLCHGANDAACRVQITGGVPPFDIQWNTGQKQTAISDLAAGDYTVTVRDATGVTREARTRIGQPPPIVLDSFFLKDPDYFGCTDTGCPPPAKNGEIRIFPAGGTPPYTIRWEKDGTDFPDGKAKTALENLGGGLYTVTMSDANECTIRKHFTLNEIPALKANIGIRQPIACFGMNTGILSGSAEGGTPPYRYRWLNRADTTARIENLSAGIYTLLVTDALDIETQCTIQLTQPRPLSFQTGLVRTPSYPGSRDGIPFTIPDDGMIHVQAKGGTPPYRYFWTDADGKDTLGHTSRIEGLKAGNYRLHIVDAAGCRTDTVFRLPKIPPLVCLLVLEKPISCWGYKDAELRAEIQGGVPPYRIRWIHEEDTIGSGPELSHITDRNYRIVVSDSLNITATYRIHVPSPDSLQLKLAAQPSLCHGDASGTVSALVSGGTAPYDYRWEANGMPLPVFDSLVENIERAELFLTVTDARGCRIYGSIYVTEPDSLRVHHTLQHPSYTGSSWQNIVQPYPDGTIALSVQGGSPPYRYHWNNGDTTASVTKADSGYYSVRVTDNNGCSVYREFRLEKTEPLFTKLELAESPLCAGDSTAAFRLQVRGGAPPYSFDWYRDGLWISEDSFSRKEKMPAGLYRIVLRDRNGIISTDSLLITEPEPLVVEHRITDASAWDALNGEIQVDIYGGTAPYLLSWGNGNTGRIQQNIGRGDYTLTVYDARLCHIQKHYTVHSPDSLFISSIAVQHTSPGGKSGAIRLSLQGGLLPYHYCWTNEQGQTLEQDSGHQNLLNLENLGAGMYRFYLNDAGGAKIDRIFEIETNRQLEAALLLENGIACHGERSAQLRAWIQGGKEPYRYTWETPSDSLKNFLQTENNLRQDGLPAGIYRIRVQDANGDTCSASLTVTQPDPLSLKAEILYPAGVRDTADGVFLLWAEGGSAPYRYLWNTGNTQARQTFFRNRSYSATVTDAGGCTASIHLDTLLSGRIQLNLAEISGISCHNEETGALQLDIRNGKPPFDLRWSNGDTTSRIENLKAGHYSVTVQDASGKTASASYRLREPEILQNGIVSVPPSCHSYADGSISLQTQGGNGYYTYTWNSGDDTPGIYGLPDGTYVVRTEDRLHCNRTDTIILREPERLQPDLRIDPIICPDGKGRIEWYAKGGIPPFRYTWERIETFGPESWPTNGSVPVIDIATAGRYRLFLSDSNQCFFDTLVRLENPLPPQYRLDTEQTICLGQTLHIRAEGSDTIPDLEYLWTFPDGRASHEPEIATQLPGMHRLTLVQRLNCVYRDSILVIASPDSIHAEFWVSSQLTAQQSCLLVSISRYRPDSTAWHIPPEAEILDREDNYLEIQFDKPGHYTVGMTSFKGTCSESFFRNILVDNVPQKQEGGNSEPGIRWKVLPNPSHGDCLLTGESNMPVRADYRIIRAANGQVHRTGTIEIPANGQNSVSLFREQDPTGLYILLLEYGTKKHNFKLIRL